MSETTHFTYCRLCDAACGLVATVEDGRLTRVRPDQEHRHSRGFACGKPQGMVDITYDPDRLVTPMLRTARTGELRPASWDDALDVCAERLATVRAEHGPESVAILSGNPKFYSAGAVLFGDGFQEALGITRRYTINSEDAASRLAASEALYGTALIPLPDFWRCDAALIIGANPLASRGSTFSEPQVRDALDAIVAGGGRVVVVDPRRGETAQRYQHVSITPGTDHWLLLAVCKLLVEVGAVAQEWVRRHARGYEDLTAALERIELAQCLDRCGVDETTVRDIVKLFVEADAAVLYGRTGTCTQRFGTLVNILQDTVLALTGNLDREGGMLLGSSPLTPTWAPAAMERAGTRRTLAEGRPEVAGRLPSAGLAGDILTQDPHRVRAVINQGCNAVLTSSGGGPRLEAALGRLDFHMALDLYRNETNHMADVLLPVTGMFERADLPINTIPLQLRPTTLYASPAVIEPVQEARDEWWILDELAVRMGAGGACPDRHLAQAHMARGRRVTLELLIDAMLANGSMPELTLRGITEKHPHGVRSEEELPTGWLVEKVTHPDGRVDLFSEEMRSELAAAHEHRDDERWPLRLIGRRERGSQNSWMHNSRRLVRDSYRMVALVHPDDAAVRGVADGSRARLTSANGNIEVDVELSLDMRRGVVSVPNGWGHTTAASWQRAAQVQGANSNELVASDDWENIAGMSILTGVPIDLHPR